MARCIWCSKKWHGPVILGVGGCEACLSVRYAVVDEVTWESLAKKPGGDHDQAFTFGNPRGGLTTMDQARCLVMRGWVRDMVHAPDNLRSQLRFSGDSDWDWAVPTDSGIWVPDPQWSDNP